MACGRLEASLMPQIKIAKDLCVGCGLCEQFCPEVFYLDEEGIACVVEGADTNNPRISDAQNACPVDAIEVEG